MGYIGKQVFTWPRIGRNLPWPLISGGTPPETTAPTGSPKITVVGTKLIAEGSSGDGWYGRTAAEILDGVTILVYRKQRNTRLIMAGF